MDLVPRHVRPLVVEALRSSRVVCLVGARQTGKSTLVRDIAKSDHPASVRTLDHKPTLTSALADPTGFVYELPRPAVIDEVQRAPEVLLAIKQLVDEDPEPRGQFLLTGSADIMTLPTVADALPGRVRYVELWPFSQGELTGVRENFLSGIFANRPPQLDEAPTGRAQYVDRIATGGFPEVQKLSPRNRNAFFDGYVSSLLAREIEDVADVRDRDAMGRLIRLVATRIGGPIDYASLSRDAAIADKTVKAYLGALERLFVVRRLEPWFTNLGQRTIKAPKINVTDTGLLAHLMRVDARGIAQDDALTGRVFEAFVVGEITRQASWADDTLHLYHYRDRGKREVDLLIERNDGTLCAIEVKSAASVGLRDLHGLRYLRDHLGDRFRCGVILYAGSTTVPFGDRLWAVPIAGLWAPIPS
jgi:uncharacterized protein